MMVEHNADEGKRLHQEARSMNGEGIRRPRMRRPTGVGRESVNKLSGLDHLEFRPSNLAAGSG
jgi:hypothetical protein